ncbi:hypothetical protein [Marinobacterium sedimentorum]|uniref:hypothetical protein n=1 Tax=Marinobacterium sedimentorum TaxID=2927804 RepID=UPI0020C5FF32|nr:hypothetical protein [Marinobacterium sedimentorum]MCP8689448.1 hypothetical protein [Marinobacterium sedimentorum]
MNKKRLTLRFWQYLKITRSMLLAAALILFGPIPVFAAWSGQDSAIAPAVDITIAPGHWGNVRGGEIRTLLSSVADTFMTYTGRPAVAPLRIRVMPRNGSPRVLYERGADGEYLVLLSARDQRWYQYAYQFSHELCHILSNFDHKNSNDSGEVVTGNQWFEESLCETASLFTLRRLARSWEQQPPSRNWIGYAPVFAAYAQHLLEQQHRHLAGNTTLANWYRQHEESLQATPYQRDKNEVVATQLLALFERDPMRWRAIRHLNPLRGSAEKAFADYLNDWQSACPVQVGGIVQQTRALFGLERHLPETPSLMLTRN